MTDVTVWHNPRCAKSRGALAPLADRDVAVIERRYLDDPSTRSELEALLDAIVAHPILLERPVDVAGDRAVVGRPPERVHELLDDAS